MQDEPWARVWGHFGWHETAKAVARGTEVFYSKSQPRKMIDE